MRGGGEFLQDFQRGCGEARDAGRREGFGVGIDESAERDGVALCEVAGADVSIRHIPDQLADLRGCFAVVGERAEGARGQVRDQVFQGLRDFEVKSGVIAEGAG